MKLHFDSNQQFQIDAVNAVVDLFDGQPRGATEFSVIDLGTAGADAGLFAGQQQSDLGAGNQLFVNPEKLRENTRAVQFRNDIEAANTGAELEGWELEEGGKLRLCPHFSVEMETGTGKTYVYLRTIFRLHERYGFAKFIIVVPSVAIREGTLKNLDITAEHFRAMFNNPPVEHFVYDAKKVNRLRQFATSTTLQILVINIDAFRKNFTGTESEQKSNVIYKESDKLSGRQPIEFVQAARPIVIIDEPQSVDSTEKSQEAIKALNPLCTLRYSATHRNLYNLVYRLDPVKAFEKRFVKQIVVASAAADGAANDAFVRVEKVEYTNGIKAKLRIHKQGPNGPKEGSVTVKQGDDLFAKSGERELYRSGYEVAEINAEPGSELIRFSSGRTLRLGEEIGGLREDIWRVQIKHTIKRHLEKELQVNSVAARRGIKVLTLFFIDKVANYRDYDSEGHPLKGKFAEFFEAELAELAKEERYRQIEWLAHPIERLHNGYFSADKKGVLKDTGGDSQADEDTYSLIMREKERLLSIDEPLRFIFSHSALREGWDNPNVFQICTLNETRSAMKKRQEIGRGLRLPVDQNGKRVFDENINKLYVMANESYEDFARALQTEYEEDCGVTFGKVPITAFAKLARIVDDREVPMGMDGAKTVCDSLVAQGMIDAEGRLQPAFDPCRLGFTLSLPENYQDLTSAVIDLLSAYKIERHVRRESDERPNQLKKEVVLTPEFKALWDTIKPKTTYRVEFETDALVTKAVEAIKRMEKIEKPRITVAAGGIDVRRGGVTTTAQSAASEVVEKGVHGIPDILAYLQSETELTRSTIFRILKESNRLDELFNNPQRFLDAVAGILKYELHRLLVDGIKYERLTGSEASYEWEQMLCDNDEVVNYLSAVKVDKSVREFVEYDSEVERRFAQQLDQREDIKLFIKLPRKFEVETPVGKYIPDWAILRHDGRAFYLVRETKDTRNFLRLRTEEADKVRCGKKHFEAIGVSFDVVVTAADVN